VPALASQSPVIVIGAGLSGLIAARTLAENDRRAAVFDKARSVGGRLATRRLAGIGGAIAQLDHGAQFFTVRSPQFRAEVDSWLSLGIAREWCRGFGDTQDGYPRYCAPGGMNAIAKHLASSANVAVNTTVSSVSVIDDGLVVVTTDAAQHLCTAAVLTPPVPQSLALCDQGGLALPEDDRARLETVRYAKCLALLVTVDRSNLIGSPGGLQLIERQDPTFSFVADNQSKQLSTVPALTLHVNDAMSERHYDDPDDSLLPLLMSEAQRYLDGAGVVAAEIKRWRYARPTVTYPHACLSVCPSALTQVVFAGDAFGEAKVEGAFLSGLAAAQSVIGCRAVS
jgi:renalase